MARQPLGLKKRQRILELARQGISAQQIARRLGIGLTTARKILAKGLAPCDQCSRVFASGDRCPVCSLLAEAPFGERLKAFRTVTGLSQFGFALQLGVTPDRVGHWEKGKASPAKHELELLAEALGLTVQALTGTAESPKGD
jgi:DNA-binding XRE family transcriptional regulator